MNKVELLGYYGSDLVHAQSAWTSTSRDITDSRPGNSYSLTQTSYWCFS